MDSWHEAWERAVAGACAESAFTHELLARNTNVHPLSNTASTLWPRHAPDLLHGWERVGYDARLVDSEPDVVCVTYGASFVPREELWTEVVAQTAEFALSASHVERAAQFLCFSHTKLLALVARGVRLGASLSRNLRLRCADADAVQEIDWDVVGLANNPALSPSELLCSRLLGRAEGTSFYCELSAHPKLRVEDVIAYRDRPWCWHTLSRSPSVTTPETYSRYKSELPFRLSGILANPLFDDAEPRPSARSVCIGHGFACSFCTTLSAASGTCGFDTLDVRLVNWEIYLRLSERPEEAVRVARDAGVFDSELSASSAQCALLGNPAATLGQVAWCIASLRASGRLTTWARVTAAANELRVARDAYEETRRKEREWRAEAVPAVLQLLRHAGLPWYMLPLLLPCAETDPGLLAW